MTAFADLTAAAIYFFVVLPINKLAERRNRGKVEEPAATAEDVLALAGTVRDGVHEAFGVTLVNEPVLVNLSLPTYLR